MSRSKGTFPRYSKVDVDPELWPLRYWDASRFCESCGTRWPNTHLFSKCPTCDIGTTIDEHSAPDMRWPDAVKSYLASRFEKLYERYNEGRTDQELIYEDEKKSEDFDFDKIDTEIKNSVTH